MLFKWGSEHLAQGSDFTQQKQQKLLPVSGSSWTNGFLDSLHTNLETVSTRFSLKPGKFLDNKMSHKKLTGDFLPFLETAVWVKLEPGLYYCQSESFVRREMRWGQGNDVCR